MKNIPYIPFIFCVLAISCIRETPKIRETPRSSHFQFSKTGPLIAPPATMARTNPTIGAYFTTLIKMDSIEDFPYDYALYFSTDHARDNGGIWLYLANGIPTEINEWISYDDAVAAGKFDYLATKPTGNPIYVDTLQGYQTETPHVNIVKGEVYMSYHNNLGHKQATMLATSPDGINFKRLYDDERAIILPPIEFLNHTGYFRWGLNPFSSVKYAYVGYSLRKGTVDYRSAMWGSHDAKNWVELHRINGWNTGKAIADENRSLIWHGLDPGSIRQINEDEYVTLTTGSTRAAGAMPRVKELYEFYVAPDGITQTRMARKVLEVGHLTDYDAEECASPVITTMGDTLHLLYVGTTSKGYLNTVMGATGTFSEAAPLTAPLPEADRRHHILR